MTLSSAPSIKNFLPQFEVLMKKKYAQSYKDRKDEHEAMEKNFRKGMKSDSFVTGNDPMVGRGDYANLPQQVMMKQYPRSPELRGGYLDDSMNGIDEINSYSERQADRFRSYQK